MTNVYCRYQYCKDNLQGMCVRKHITLARNLHDGATCMDTHFVNQSERSDDGAGGQTIRQTED